MQGLMKQQKEERNESIALRRAAMASAVYCQCTDIDGEGDTHEKAVLKISHTSKRYYYSCATKGDEHTGGGGCEFFLRASAATDDEQRDNDDDGDADDCRAVNGKN